MRIRKIFAFANNHYAGHAPATVKQIWDLYRQYFEVCEEPTVHRVDVAKMLCWLKEPGRYPRDKSRKEKARSTYQVIELPGDAASVFLVRVWFGRKRQTYISL